MRSKLAISSGLLIILLLLGSFFFSSHNANVAAAGQFQLKLLQEYVEQIKIAVAQMYRCPLVSIEIQEGRRVIGTLAFQVIRL